MSNGKLTWNVARNSADAEGGSGKDRAALIWDAERPVDIWEEAERDRVAGVIDDKVNPM